MNKKYIAALVIILLQSSPLLADTAKKIPTMLVADDVFYNYQDKIVIAEGGVEVVQGRRMLIADKIIYNQKSNIVTAIGNISLLEPDGTVLFAHEAELRDDLKKGVVEKFSVRLNDGSVLTANSAVRENEKKIVLNKAIYSPCPVCKDKPEKKPLWQIKAKKVTLDEEKQRVTYKNAKFEVLGVPALYTPYMSHPSPNAKRKTGILVPSYRNESTLGDVVKVPVYLNIAPNKDAIIAPIYTSKEGPLLQGEYRHLITNGSYNLEASITNPDKINDEGGKEPGNEVRGHIEGSGEFKYSNDWLLGFKGKRSTDDTYLQKYRFGNEDVLTSRAFFEQKKERDYNIIQAISFQGLNKNDDPGKTPLILPSMSSYIETKPDKFGAKWSLSSDALVLSRDEGASSRRLSTKGEWSLPYITNNGNVFKFSSSLRGDAYHVDDVLEISNNSSSQPLDGETGRIIPESVIEWSLPLVKENQTNRVFLEPTVQAIVSPYGGNPNKIPNEDSQDVEFADENLFNTNHFSGLDRVEGGPRANYGLRTAIHDSEYGKVNMLFGQTYHTKENKNFSSTSGLDQNFSDFVGRLHYETEKLLSINYKTRVDRSNFSPNRNSVDAEINISPVSFKIDYLSLNEDFAVSEEDDFQNTDREQIIYYSSLDISKYWTFYTNSSRNLEEGEWISSSASLNYKGECIDFLFTAGRSFTQDRDIRPSTSFSFQISLRNLN